MKRDNIGKKITNAMHFALCISAASLLLTSCTFEQDDYFDETAALRVTHINNSIKKQLVDQSAEGKYGWVIQYFVAGTDDYDFEGFNLFGRFYDNNKVLLASNHRFLRNGNANNYAESTSTYKMLAEEGPVLSFDTWNDILTVFEDPVDPTAAPGTISNNGEGMFGDHNLVLSALKDDEILFRGERHRAEIRFIPCDRPWTDYIAAVAENKNHIATSKLTSYYVTNVTDTLYFVDLNKGVFVYGERIVDPLKKKTLSCVFTPNGFRINHVDSIGDNAFQEFFLADDKTKLLSEDGKTQVIACWDNYVVDCPSYWRIDPNKFTQEQATLYAQMEAEVKKVNSNYVLDSIAIGRTVETMADKSKVAVPGLVLCIHGPARMGRIPQYKPYVVMNIDRTQFGQVRFSESSDDTTYSAMAMFNGTDLKNMCKQFAKTMWGTYDIAPNDFFCPSYADLKPIGGGNTIGLILK